MIILRITSKKITLIHRVTVTMLRESEKSIGHQNIIGMSIKFHLASEREDLGEIALILGTARKRGNG